MITYKTIKSGNYKIELATDSTGRTSIVVKLVVGTKSSILLDVELPCTKGEDVASFAPRLIYDLSVFKPESTVKPYQLRVDNSSFCKVDSKLCSIPNQCRIDNGYDKHCEKCFCRNCNRSDCSPP